MHYAKQLAPELKKALDADEVKTAEDLKTHANPVLKGFSDLLNKKKFFDQELKSYDETTLRKAFYPIYNGAGFDDEEAFFLAFHDMNLAESKTAQHHYEQIKTRLKPEDRAEVEDYFRVLEAKNAILKEVNFLSLVDESEVVRGFAIFHLMQQGGQTIMHVRQAAMRDQERGYAGLMARYFVEHYPKAIYEANQRRANFVGMKKHLLEEKLIVETPAVLGYSNEFYRGLCGINSVLNSFLLHNQKSPAKIGFLRFGKYAEAESIPKFFSPAKLAKEAIRDDNFSQVPRHYLKKK